VDGPEIPIRELPPTGDGHLPRHLAADSERFGHRNGRPDTPRSGEALAALDDVERAARDLADARSRLATSVDRLRAPGSASSRSTACSPAG
jgi:hypothetical protein